MNTPKSDRNPLEKLTEEFIRRRRAGESPTIEEYAERYPDLAEEIHDVFPLMLVMEDVRDDVAEDQVANQQGSAGPIPVGANIGDYRILRKIGQGGMGIVFEAEQESLGRRVALKVLSPGVLPSPKYLQRFQREARAAAKLQHTNIVPVFGVGEEDGIHYYVMQYIHGRGMDEVMTAIRRLPRNPDNADAVTEPAPTSVSGDGDARDDTVVSRDSTLDATRLLSGIENLTGGSSNGSGSRSTYFERVAELGANAADALAYAHRHGILHRDVKPSNLLLDVGGNLWVTDFGLAKVEGEQDLTATGDIVGTLRYIAPESLQGQFDGRGDVYGLGLTLYELVTRRQAFESSERGELLRQISDEGPPRITRQSGVPRDLETVICKAIERNPNDRYVSAEDLAGDLRRFIRHEPVLARRISAPARLIRWANRNRALAAVSALLLAGLLVGFVASLVASSRLLRLTDDLTSALHDSRQRNYVGDIGLAFEAIQRGDLRRAKSLLGNHLPGPDEEDLRGFEWRYLWSRTRGNFTADLGPYQGFLAEVAISPDGQFVALQLSSPRRIEVIDLSTGTKKLIEVPSWVSALYYSPSGDLLVGAMEGKIVAWNTRTWENREALSLHTPFAFGHRKDKEIFVARDGNHFSVWNATDWEEIGDLPNDQDSVKLLEPGYGESGHMATCVAVSSDDKFFYLAGRHGVRRWDLDQKKELTPLNVSSVPTQTQWGQGLSSIATSGDGQLAVADRWGNVHLMDPQTGKFLHTFQSHIGWVSCLKFSRDGSRLVSGGGDRNVVLYDPVKRSMLNRLLGHGTQVWGLDISADGRTVVSGSGNGGRVLTWSLEEAGGWELERAGVRRFAIMEDSQILFLRDAANDAEFYDPIDGTLEPAGTERFVQILREVPGGPLAASPHGKWIVTKEANTLIVWDQFTAKRVRTLSHDSGEIAGGGLRLQFFHRIAAIL